MKNKQKELDVDFSGGQKPMTKEEELAISEFIRADKENLRLKTLRRTKTKTSQRSKQTS